ncbi:MAG: prepilin-type N-terminal cleavage/methylation domain-containing protein [Leptospiraceae bacterium]|nr:prepilin-type N-terminal cleavage/methylation domain-containing protein [Leptospiraceae bacterium]MDW7975734.1 prepilin-type N-terminal cleavage/methylation domain-containing protein [Leptospiraceae bacterium]
MVKKITKGLTIIELSVVLLIISLVLSILFSMVSQFSIFKTKQDEAEILKDIYRFAKSSSTRSGQIIYVEFDLENQRYSIYRKVRNKETIENQNLIERELFLTNRILFIRNPYQNEVSSGIYTIQFFPNGVNDEVYIYLGGGDKISKTIIFPRYGKEAIIKDQNYQELPQEAILNEKES